MDLEKIPATSFSIRLHIMRAFLQCFLWENAPLNPHTEINPCEYGYELMDDEERLFPVITFGPSLPDDFLLPCTCQKSARENVCLCRKKKINCCEFYKCCASKESCKNPHK